MSSKKLSRDQKRRAKLAERKRRQKPADPLPYEGQKYRADAYVPYVLRTEVAVLDAYLESNRKVTNDQVRQAFVQLIERLRHHSLAVVADVEAEARAELGTVEDVVLRIRRGWQDLFAQRQPCSRDDMIGILRMLLFSIEAQGWNSGPGRGYLVFLEKFIKGMA